MISTVEFKKEHMEYLLKFQAKEYKEYMTSEVMQALEDSKKSLTFLNEYGEVLLCGGVKKIWDGRGELWAVFNNVKGSYSASLHKAVKKGIEVLGLKRTETVVIFENTLGHKLVKKLGFKIETERLTAYLPNGGDASMYVRIN